ncbi:hypothetical protein HK101_001344 [Irineochytrium annulatum]|nr:hypothetical protein HK101_001344 [Irineochytrium annulatum]
MFGHALRWTTRPLLMTPTATASVLTAGALLLCGFESKLHAEKATAAPPVVDPSLSKDPSGTGVELPNRITLFYPNKSRGPSVPHEFSLLGLGVRQVTPLRFNVYVIGIYGDNGALAGIKSGNKWRSFSPSAWLKDRSFAVDLCRKPGTELTLVLEV